MRYLICLILPFLSACDGTAQNLALGTLERDRIAHTATASEVVVDLPVAPGSQVSKGTILVKLDNTLQLAEVDKAAAEVARAEANLEKLRNGARAEEVAAATANVAGARASLVESRSNYTRILNLKKQKLVSQSELDRARSVKDAAQAGLESAQEALRLLTNGTREEDLRAAEASLNSAKATLAIQTKRLEDLTITATRDGILDNLPWNLGERVTIGSPLAIILAGKAPHARVYIPEPYRVKLQVGDSLTVHVDGIEQPLTGQLSWIATEPAFTPYYALNQEERARLMYLAEVQLADSEAELPNGVPAQVELP
ncbi:HlyD family secretion protein [Amphritea pacifica]|uniref:HlyD family efflux transporter periplasmic adaptor subunit n=1 Tax=Amphritea pacifica TaxID=2811233 RepID=A0ABS2WDR4_9GAMM|nr:HlyD family efflux transporter periplasmic adaptor subunit [Amphritea pacifica]MBN0989828.1 HlyD family efflux transporter periplasmic adaptor subunit [Amphritea pacifica]MBN1009128.1 HlyD family efflux transporter periplasmic adaptor subunit [Amphritea pacifica]